MTLYYRIEDLLYRLRYAWQRAYRGYDDTATWSLRDHIAENSVAILDKMIKERCGYPVGLSDELWGEELKKMRDMFQLMLDDVWYCNEENKKKYDEGMKSFSKYYPHLWD